MTKNSEKRRIVLASNNPGKIREINTLMNDSNFNVISQSDFNVIEPEETGVTFVENALLKARNASHYTHHPVIADDSGIEVLALKGSPGIYSARYAGPDASDEDNLHKLIDAIKTLPKEERQARFVCLMVFLKGLADPLPIIAQGIWNGYVGSEPKGVHGFGYDPIFFVPEHHCTAAELTPNIKNKLSHRSQALRLLLEQINDRHDEIISNSLNRQSSNIVIS